MTVEITIRDDAGNVVASRSGAATTPTELKLVKPLVDQTYEIWGFTYQPHVRVMANWVAMQQGR